MHYAKAPAALPGATMLFEIHTEKNTQLHARGIFYFKHCAKRRETVATSPHTYLPLLPTVEIKLSDNHVNIFAPFTAGIN